MVRFRGKHPKMTGRGLTLGGHVVRFLDHLVRLDGLGGSSSAGLVVDRLLVVGDVALVQMTVAVTATVASSAAATVRAAPAATTPTPAVAAPACRDPKSPRRRVSTLMRGGERENSRARKEGTTYRACSRHRILRHRTAFPRGRSLERLHHKI